MVSGGCGCMVCTSMKSSMEAVLDFPFSRNEEEGAERPRIWGAAVESAESVERERFTSMCGSAAELFDGRPLWARREPGGRAVTVVVVVADVGLDEDDASRFLFTMLGRPVEAARQPIARGGQRNDGEARACKCSGGGRGRRGDGGESPCEKVCAGGKRL
jgi:hypothetical protein